MASRNGLAAEVEEMMDNGVRAGESLRGAFLFWRRLFMGEARLSTATARRPGPA